MAIQNEQAVIDLKINNKSAALSLDELNAKVKALTASLSKMNKEDDPALYEGRIRNLKNTVAARDAEKAAINGSALELKKYQEEFARGLKQMDAATSNNPVKKYAQNVSDSFDQMKKTVANNPLKDFFGSLQNQAPAVNTGYFAVFVNGYNAIAASVQAHKTALEESKTAIAENLALEEANAVAVTENTAAQELNNEAIAANIVQQEVQKAAVLEATTIEEAQAAAKLYTKTVQEGATLATEAETLAVEEQTLAAEAQTIAQEAENLATLAGVESMGKLKIAFASTGIGLLILALGSLIAYFTSTNEGAEKLKEITARLNALFQETLKAITPVGKALADLLSGDFKGFSADIAAAKNNFLSLGENIGKSANAAEALQKQRYALKLQEEAWTAEKVKQKGVIEDLTKKFRDQNLSEKERLDNGEKAKVLINAYTQKELDMANQNLNIVKAQQAIESKKDITAIPQAEEKRNQVLRERTNLLDNVENKESSLEKKGRTRADSAAEKAEKQADKDRELRLKTLADAAADVADAYGKEIIKLDEHYRELEYKNRGNAATVEQLKKEHLQKLAELSDKFQKEDAAKLDKINQELQKLAADAITDGTAKGLAELQAGTDAKLQELDKEDALIKENIAKQQTEVAALKQQGKTDDAKVLEDEIARELNILDASGKLRLQFLKNQAQKEQDIKEAAANAVTNDKDAAGVTKANSEKDPAGILTGPAKDQMEAEQKQADDEHTQKVAQAVKNGQTTYDIDAKYEQAKYNLKKKYADQEANIEKTRLQVVANTAEALMGLVGKQTIAYKIFSAARKAAAIAEVIVSETNEIQNYWDAYADIPFAGPVIATGLSVAAVARGANAINNIRKSDTATAAKGAIVNGPSHADGGIDLINTQTGERILNMEGGEPIMILSKETRRNNGELINQLLFNSMYKNGAQVNTTAISQGIQLARFGTLINTAASPNSSSGENQTSTAAQNQSRMEELMMQMIEAQKQANDKHVIFSDRVFENYTAKKVQIRTNANA